MEIDDVEVKFFYDFQIQVRKILSILTNLPSNFNSHEVTCDFNIHIIDFSHVGWLKILLLKIDDIVWKIEEWALIFPSKN